MSKSILTFAAAGLVAITATTAPAPAEARHGGAVAAGIIGGLAAGALIAGAHRPYGPYYYGPAYYGAYGPGCVIRRERVWNGYRWVWQRVRVCY
ncbi:MAG: hypothetical protein K8H87_07570 [Pseudorhodoplanes sp.]|nr:hypothetical protein [Pseudorhodoplanes sp.]